MIVCGTSILFLSTAVAADQPDIQDATRRLIDWKRSFTNLRMVFEVRNAGQWLKRKPEIADAGNIDGYYRRHEWIYTDDGRCRHEVRYFEAGRLVRKRIEGNDGKIEYRSEFYGDSESPSKVGLDRLHPTGYSNLEALPPIDLLYRGRDEWIGDVFARSHPEVIRHETADGKPYVVVRRAADDTMNLLLDVTHDCLPCRDVGTSGNSGAQQWIHEFRQLSNGRWFPARGRRLLSPEDTPYEWVVTEIEVNLTLPEARFAPPQPSPKTRVIDLTR
ncbi:MAG: hypothetical protein B7Z55_13460 [Planctomycetales bacterium 12-60-4]|nr:MAG: hypothetical protein B7Z55_13460 [Planctomycetales bacterium 12-60-4]